MPQLLIIVVEINLQSMFLGVLQESRRSGFAGLQFLVLVVTNQQLYNEDEGGNDETSSHDFVGHEEVRVAQLTFFVA